MTNETLTQDEVAQLMQDQEFRQQVQQHMGEDQYNTVESNIALQLKILEQESKETTQDLLSRDIFLANLTKEDKDLVNHSLDLSLRFRQIGLKKTAAYFYTQCLVICGVSRGYEGFQQKEFNVRREMRESHMDGLKKSNSWIPWRKRR